MGKVTGRILDKGNFEPLCEALQTELAALEALSDDAIDTSDIAPVSDWSGARRGNAIPTGQASAIVAARCRCRGLV